MPSTTHFNCPTCDRHCGAIRGAERELKNLRAKVRRVYRKDLPRAERLSILGPLWDAQDDYRACLDIDRQALRDHLAEG